MYKITQTEHFNVLIAGEGKYIEYIKTSKFLKKLYSTSEKEFDGIIAVNFNTFKELAKKCKALQIDFVIPENPKWIKEGMCDVLKSYFVNCIAPTAKWTELGVPDLNTRKLLGKYNINTPPVTLVPSEFPLLVKGNGILKRADSVQDVIRIQKEVYENSPVIAKDLYLEKYLDGEKIILTSLFDTKHLITFPTDKIPKNLTDEYTKKLENLLQQNNADFIGFINSEVIIYDNKLYNTGFTFDFCPPKCNVDILYILSLAIYQKIDEIDFNRLV